MPKFPKSSGFKMKGYAYPGTSPIKEAKEDAANILGSGKKGKKGKGELTDAGASILGAIATSMLQTGAINSEKRIKAAEMKAQAARFPTPQTTTKIV
tara:strand:- start:607 stop:897 length:291 start_codon:yes stop_codon:yes gene_type:complete